MGGQIISFQDRLDRLNKAQEGNSTELTQVWHLQMVEEMKALSTSFMSMQEKLHTLEAMGFASLELGQRESVLSAPTSATRAFSAPRHPGVTPRHERFMFDDDEESGSSTGARNTRNTRRESALERIEDDHTQLASSGFTKYAIESDKHLYFNWMKLHLDDIPNLLAVNDLFQKT